MAGPLDARCLKIQVSQKVWGTPMPELCPIHPKPSGRRGEIAKFKNITMQKNCKEDRSTMSMNYENMRYK